MSCTISQGILNLRSNLIDKYPAKHIRFTAGHGDIRIFYIENSKSISICYIDKLDGKIYRTKKDKINKTNSIGNVDQPTIIDIL